MTSSKALNLIKGYVARLSFLLAPELELRYPKRHLWSRGNFATTIGFNNLEETVAYVNNQDEHHKLYYLS